MDFFARQESARRSTRWLLVAFLLCVVLVVAAITVVVYWAALQRTHDPEMARVPAVLLGLGTFVIICGGSVYKTMSLREGGGVVARSLGGVRVGRETRDLAIRRLHNIVEEMAIASGVSMPEVYVLESEEGINAFAAGNSPADAAIAVTRGALTRLNREELQGVIAHEFSHVLNGDMRLNSKLLGWVFGLLVIVLTARLVLSNAGRSGGKRDNRLPIVLISIFVIGIGYLGVMAARLLQAAVSRHRERLADSSAVQFTRNPTGLVGALLKIAGVESGSKLDTPNKEEAAHMLFAPGMARLFATHPPITERIYELDPSLKKENIPALAATAAREAEKMRLAPTFADVASEQPVTSQLREPVDSNTAPKRVTNLAGTFDETQMAYAQEARESIPDELRGYADAPDAARVLLFAMLRGADEVVAGRQDHVILSVYGESMLGQIRRALPVANGLAPALRLPAVQQLLPAMRRMTQQERRELRAAAERFALADLRVDVFECCLTLLLEAALRDDLEGRDEHGSRSLAQSAPAVGNLFAVLAAQGAADPDEARKAYDAGMSNTLPQASLAYAPVKDWPAALRGSLHELASLRPFAKKVLIEGLVRTVAHDRRLSVAEGELLRTVCAVLHCPLPPILAARSPG